jgi:hypothetical protein
MTLSNGTGTFSVTLYTDGPQSITATDTVDGSITGTQAGIAVTPAAASTLVVSGFPTQVTAGDSTNLITVTAYDAYGNVATGYAGTVHFSSSDAQAALPADTTLSNGTGTFSVTLFSAGVQSLTVADTVSGGLSDDPAAAAVARMRLFAGMSVEETAAALNISRATAFRDWAYARAVLSAALADENNSQKS